MVKIPEGWIETTLGQLVDFIDGDRGKNYPKNFEFYDNGFCLFLNAKNIPDRKFDFSEKTFISEEKDKQLNKGKLEIGDFVITTRGTIGNFAYFDELCTFKKIRINSGMVIVRNKNLHTLENSYLNSYLSGNLFKNSLSSFTSGSAVPQLPIKDLKLFPIFLPPLPEQKAIAGVLSAFDDKIELLRAENQTLEEVGQTLFKEWFRPPYPLKGEISTPSPLKGEITKPQASKGEISTPSPLKGEITKPQASKGEISIPSPLKGEINGEVNSKSPLGDLGAELPDGWKVGKLGDIIELQGGYVHNPNLQGEVKCKIAKMGVVDGKTRFNRNSVIDYYEDINEKHKLYEDDLIVCTRDVTYDRIIIGNVARVPKDLADFGLYAGSNTWIIKTNYNKNFLFYLLRDSEFRRHIKESAKGSTIIMITKDAFLDREIVIPNNTYINEKMNILNPIINKIKTNSEEIESLSKTRDQLLPKLMSGEVRVKF